MKIIELAKILHDVINEICAQDCDTIKNLEKLQNHLQTEIAKIDND